MLPSDSLELLPEEGDHLLKGFRDLRIIGVSVKDVRATVNSDETTLHTVPL